MKDWLIPFAIVAMMIVLDIVSGIAKASYNKTLDSSKMREGLWHKAGYLMVMACSCVIEWGSQFMDLGFDLPLVVPVCVFIVMTEVVSVLENAAAINPDLKNTRLLSFFRSSMSSAEQKETPKKGDGE